VDDAFLGQMDHLTNLCHANAPLREGVPVRMPGERAESRIADARAHGLILPEPTLRQLDACAERYGLDGPRPER
jgi:LDH2 family malate/lactate/ureidoglycolate dehydrogenase